MFLSLDILFLDMVSTTFDNISNLSQLTSQTLSQASTYRLSQGQQTQSEVEPPRSVKNHMITTSIQVSTSKLWSLPQLIVVYSERRRRESWELDVSFSSQPPLAGLFAVLPRQGQKEGWEWGVFFCWR